MLQDLKMIEDRSVSVTEIGIAMVEALEDLRYSFPEPLVERANSIEVLPRPVIFREDDWIVWRFRLGGSQEAQYEPEVAFATTGSQSPSARGLDLVASIHCTCPYHQHNDCCKHTAAIVNWLFVTIAEHDAEWLEQWLASLTSASPQVTDALVRDLIEIVSEEEQADDKVASRLQWRVRLGPSSTYGPLTIRPYEQRITKSGKGWTRGREMQPHLVGISQAMPDSASDADRKMMAHLRAFSFTYDFRRTAHSDILPLLVGHPNVVWDNDPQTLVTVEEHPLRLSLRESGNGFRVIAELGDMLLTPCSGTLAVCGGDVESQRFLAADHERNRLLLARPAGSRLNAWLKQLIRRGEKALELDCETATQLAQHANRLTKWVDIELPEALTGPSEPLAAEVSLLLSPTRHGLQAALRVADPRLRDPVVPGLPPREVAATTEEGPLRLVRDLDQERDAAEGIAERLSLGALAFLGEYTWESETDDAALRLLDTLRELGDEAPPVLWPEGQKIRSLGEILPQSLRVKVEDRRDWFGLSGSVEIDGIEIALADLLAAIRSGHKYVRVGDDAFARVSDAFRRRLEQLGDSVQPDRGGVRVANAAVPVVQELIGEDIPLEAVARWRETIERLDAVRKLRPRVPRALKADLRPYQQEGYRWLARLSAWGAGGILADDMGLGKTVQTLGILLDRAAEGPTLVVAPTSVGENWLRETARFAPRLTPHLYRDADRDSLIESVGARDLVIVSYALLRRDAERFSSRPWHTLVLDEAQYIKNAATKTAQVARSLEADWRLGLSGTPLENHLGELWSLMRTISPGLLGSWEHFRTRFADPIEKSGDEKSRESLARLMQPFILRRTKNAVLTELPARTEVTLYAEMGKAERKRYEAARLAALADLSTSSGREESEGQKRFRVLTWLTRMRQIACHPRLVDPQWKHDSAKLQLLIETIDELREGEHRALVFSQFVQHLALVREALDKRGISYQYLDGSTPAAERQKRVDAFQRGEGELFLISLKAGGTGLNLTAADYVIHLDPWWNPAVEDQATDRAHRIGQSRPVNVFRLVARDTIEEQILALHGDKRELVASVLDGTDRAGRMTTNEMIRLIRGGAGE